MDPDDNAPLPDRPDRPLPRNLQVARDYLAAIENGATSDALGRFFAPEAIHREFPNRLNPEGSVNGLGEILDAAERGKQSVANQRFEIRNAVAEGERVALEVFWTGSLKKELGTLPIGGEMRAHFAVFLEFRDGKIIAQNNYDCFEEF
jgi:ketosteroid isomerase-like protein